MKIQIDSMLGLADRSYLSENRLALPVFETEPQSSGCNVFLCNRLDIDKVAPDFWQAGQEVRRWRSLAGANNAADEALVLHGEEQAQVHLCGRYGCQAKSGFGDIVEVRTHVRKV